MNSTTARPDVQAVLDLLAAQPGPAIDEQNPAAARAGLLVSVAAADLPAPETAVARDLAIPGPGGPIPALLLDPRPARTAAPVLVWYHGGGFVTGGIATHRGFAADLARRLDLPVVLVGYRLAPEHPFPAAPDDAEAAARWVAANPSELGFDVQALIIGGDSAGGTLAIATTMALRDDPAPVPVRCHVAIYPATDLTRPYPSQREFADGYLLTERGRAWYYGHYQPVRDDVRASPLLGRMDGMPPAVILAAGLDPVRDEGRAYAQALIAAGVPTTYLEAVGNIHAFVLMRKAVPSTNQDIARTVAALEPLVHIGRIGDGGTDTASWSASA